jgi:glutathione synthase
MTLSVGVVMDPIGSINYKKDSTLAMLLEASARGCQLFYFEQRDLFIRDGQAFGQARELSVYPNPDHWFDLSAPKQMLLADLDIMLMRKDPPFDREYIYTTYILENAEKHGAFVVNKPQSLRDANEKLFATWFPDCCPSTLVTRSHTLLSEFLYEHKQIVCKPLDGMGGSSIFKVGIDDANINVIFETLTQGQQNFMMAQQFIPEISNGDKRILMINGEPLEYSLARMPAKGEWRGNLAAGAQGVAQPLSERDRWICQQVGPTLREKGLYFVGLDVIGDYLTEINVTSPTCIRELDEQCGLNIAGQLWDFIFSRK